MRFQMREWSCGSASVVNALQQFGIHVPERQVIPIAGTNPPSKCPHCNKLNALLAERKCKKSYWKCRCNLCRTIRREWRRDCHSGTNPKGVMTAIRHFGGEYGLTAAHYESESKNDAWQWLHGSLMHGRVVILCVDSWRHWVLAYSGTVDRVHIFDPYPSRRNLLENGHDALTKTELMRRWWNARECEDGEKRLYAISVGR